MKGQINNPCSMQWQDLDSTNDAQSHFCQTKVHDVTQVNEEALHQFYLNYEGKLCIKADKKQLKPNKAIYRPWWKKIGMIGWTLLSFFF